MLRSVPPCPGRRALRKAESQTCVPRGGRQGNKYVSEVVRGGVFDLKRSQRARRNSAAPPSPGAPHRLGLRFRIRLGACVG